MGIYFLPLAVCIFLVQTLSYYEIVPIAHVRVLEQKFVYLMSMHDLMCKLGFIFVGVLLVLTLVAFMDTENRLRLRKQINILGYIFLCLSIVCLL